MTRPSARMLAAALVFWSVFGTWTLFRPVVNGGGVDPLVGHLVLFFFVSLAAFGLLWRPLGGGRTLIGGGLLIVFAAAASELLQPILTQTRQAQPGDFLANLGGIVGAAVVTLLLAAVVRRTAPREVATALLCFCGLAGATLFLVVGPDTIRTAIECRGRGLDPVGSVAGEPIVVVDEASSQAGDGPVTLLSDGPQGDGVVGADSADLRCSVMRANGYSIVATVVPDSLDSGGPTRIFTSSIGTDFDEYNTHIGQDFDELSVRIRSGDGRQWESVPDVFEAEQRVTVAIVVSGGERSATVVVDGEVRATFELEGTYFASWNSDYPMLVGDEFTRDRTFEGVIESVRFYDRALAVDDALLLGN